MSAIKLQSRVSRNPERRRVEAVVLDTDKIDRKDHTKVKKFSSSDLRPNAFHWRILNKPSEEENARGIKKELEVEEDEKHKERLKTWQKGNMEGRSAQWRYMY